MNDIFSNEIKNAFNSFRNILETRIKNNNVTYYDNDCYLVDNKWYNELEKNIKDYENNQLSYSSKIYVKKKIYKPKLSLPQQFPDFINDMNIAIELIKSNDKPKLIGKNIINSIYKKEDLKNYIVKYVAGFNNLIIMFMGEKFNSGFLLFNPLDKDNNINIIISFIIKNKKNENNAQLYSELLQMKNEINKTLLENLRNMNKIAHYEIINNNEEISYETNNNTDEDILKIFIKIFYYEKDLLLYINEIISKYQKFNLIKPDWIIKFKNHYNYELLYDLLSDYDNKRKGINYFNLDEHMNDILLYSKNDIKVDKIDLPENLITSDSINPLVLNKNNKIFYYGKSYLIPYELMDSIKQYAFKNSITNKPKEIFSSKENNIFIIDSFNIILGNINENLIFFPEYIFSFDSKDILNEEKEIIYYTPILEYIQQKNCDQNDSSIQELLDNESSKQLGKFITLSNNSKIEKNIFNSEISINKRIYENKINNNYNKNNSVEKKKIFKNYESKEEMPKRKKRFHREIDTKNISMSEGNNLQKKNQMLFEKKNAKLKNQYFYNSYILTNDSEIQYKSQQIIDESDMDEQNDLNNKSNLEELHKKIEELKKDNESKKEELNNYKNILEEKDKNIQKINEYKSEIEKLKINKDKYLQEKNILLNNLETNKKEIENKKEQINKLNLEKKNEKENYENIITSMNEEINELKINLKEKENELLKYKEKEEKLKKLKDIEKLIEKKNKEIEDAKKTFDGITKDNNEFNKKNNELKEEINRKQKEYEQILLLFENKKIENDEINNKYEKLNKNFSNLSNQLNKKEEELKNKEIEIQKKEEKMKLTEEKLNSKEIE